VFLKSVSFYRNGSIDELMESKPKTFENYNTKSNDVAIIGFTSGTTGNPKMTAHYHKDILNICESFPKYSLQPTEQDVFTGSPPIGFTFGLGGLVLFPMYFGDRKSTRLNSSHVKTSYAAFRLKKKIKLTSPLTC